MANTPISYLKFAGKTYKIEDDSALHKSLGYMANEKNYPVQDSNGKLYVNVPWTDTNTTYNNVSTETAGLMSSADKTKLDNISGQVEDLIDQSETISAAINGLDDRIGDVESNATTSKAGLMSSADKSKLDGIASGANAYTHPSYTSKSSGLYKITVDGTGHVSGTTAVAKTDITNLGIPEQDTTYGAATTAAAGLMTSAMVSKLNGIANNANNYTYTLPTASSSTKGGILLGYSTSDKNYAVQLDSNGKAYVNVPWTDANTTYGAATTATAGLMSSADKIKLDNIGEQVEDLIGQSETISVAINGLDDRIGDVESNDATTSKAGLMSSADKSKLDGIANNANNYSHPTYTSKSSGLYKITVDGTGHVSGTTAVTKADITNLGIPGQDTTYSNATTAAAGLMTSAMVSKLNGISTSANNYSLPTASSSTKGGILLGYSTSDKNYAVQLDSNGKAYVNVPWTDANTTYGNATSSTAGLMSTTDKSKLDSIASGANAYTHPSYTSKSSGLYKITVDGTGHVSGTTAVTKADITNLGIPGQDTTYGAATTAAAGLMSSADKTKLDNISGQVEDLIGQSETISVAINGLDDRIINIENNIETLLSNI